MPNRYINYYYYIIWYIININVAAGFILNFTRIYTKN